MDKKSKTAIVCVAKKTSYGRPRGKLDTQLLPVNRYCLDSKGKKRKSSYSK